MPIKKFANAEVADIISMKGWEESYAHRHFRAKTATQRKIAADQSRYLLSHCTIMASVATEQDPEDHLIKPESAHFVNNNQDAWTNDVLRLSYRSFVGAFNFLEHFQNSKASKGHILDSVLRKVFLTPEAWIYYCDILVATDLAHLDLVEDIRTEKIKYMSMGCLTDMVICSYCGARCTERHTYCEHLLYRKGDFLYDDGGIPRRVAELCGHKSLPSGGVKFVEASWVATPAAPSAVRRGTVLEEWVGPKTPYSQAAKLAAFHKEASRRVGPVAQIPFDLKRALRS